MRPLMFLTVGATLLAMNGCKHANVQHGLAASIADLKRFHADAEDSGGVLRVRGAVTFAAALSDFFVIQDASGGLQVALPKGHVIYGVGALVEVSGRFSESGAVSFVESGTTVIGARATLPAVSADSSGNDLEHHIDERVVIDGVIQSAILERPRLASMVLRSGSRNISLKTILIGAYDLDSYVDAEVKAGGVVIQHTGSERNDLELWVPGVDDLKVMRPAVPLASIAVLSVATLRSRPSGGHRIRLRGQEASAGAGGFRLRDDTGEIQVSLANSSSSLPTGKLDVAGFFSPSRGGIENAVLVAGSTADPASANGTFARDSIVRSALAVHQLSPEEASRHYPVELHAVVTFSNSAANLLFVQDASDGIYVQLSPRWNATLAAGDLVDLTGETSPGDFAPTIFQARAQVLGHARMPSPGVNFESTFMGQQDSRWVRLEGVVQDAVRTSTDVLANLVWGKHAFRIHVLAPLDQVKALIDRRVRVSGACGSLFNNRRQVLGIQLYVPGIEFIQPEAASLPDPFTLPTRPASSLLQFSKEVDLGHRVHIHGIVTLPSLSGPTWIIDQNAGLTIESHDPIALKDGDSIDAVGFPEAGNYGPVLKAGIIRKLSSGPPVAPARTTAFDAAKGMYESQLIQVDATLVDESSRDGRPTLTLQSGNDVFTAQLQSADAYRRFPIGSLLRIAGICTVNTDDSQGTLLARGFRLTPRGNADIVVLRNAPWLTASRLVLILSITLLFAGATLFWVILLRRNVRTQTQKLISKTSQLEDAYEMSRASLSRAQKAESLEQRRKHLLELVAKNEPLELIMPELASAMEDQSAGTMCSLQINLPDGTRLAASPSVQLDLARELERLPISSFAPTLEISGIRRLSTSGRWMEFLANGDRYARTACAAVPILAGAETVGVMITIFSGERESDNFDPAILVSWGQFANLAVERRGLYEKLSFRAKFDALTGLNNRASLYERLGQDLVQARRSGATFAILYLDLDKFKTVNDRHGHEAGDVVLREISKRILQSVRRSDLVARIGGDEFVVVLSRIASRSEAERIAAILAFELAQPIHIGNCDVECGASIGISLFPFDGDSPESLLKKADARMYESKAVPSSARSI